MKKYQVIGIIAILLFSFFYAEKIANIALENNPIYHNIMDIKDDYKVEPVNAIIDGNFIIPGLNGLYVNEKKSYYRMKKLDTFNDKFLMYNSIIPKISLNNNIDKIISRGNKLKNAVAIIIEDNKTVADYFIKKGINISILVNASNYQNYQNVELINNDDKNYSSMEAILNKNNKNTNICVINENIKDICYKYRKYLVKTNLIVNNQSIINIKNNISSGDIYYIGHNLDIEKVDILIRNIFFKDLKIVFLSHLISEERY